MFRVAVAASGGRDSTALLHCTLRQAREVGGLALPGQMQLQVLALHVHHGLMPQADDWLLQVKRQAHRWGATFASRRLTAKPARGQSVEAWARIERYRALAEMAADAQCDLVLLAHHRRDQAETWLLQALRGAGNAGLAAMPALAQRQGITWARPWLNQPVQAIEAYVRRHRLQHAEDPSNADPRFARSRLRQTVWPALSAAFENLDITLAGAAARAQEALALAQEAAAADLPAVTVGTALQVNAWLQLPPARRKNVLRAWLHAQLGTAPAQTLVSRLLAEVPSVSQGAWPAPGACLRLRRAALTVEDLAPAALKAEPRLMDLSQPGVFAMAEWGGHWEVQRVLQGGVAPERLRQVLAHARIGGEHFRLTPRGASRSLKKQFQALDVPAWQRHGPLLSGPDGSLLFVPGLGLDASCTAPGGVGQLALRWVPDPPLTRGAPHRPG